MAKKEDKAYMKLDKGTKFYTLCKVVLGFIYKLYYHPVVIGKENIPKSGSVVITGNHKHIMDQCNTIISCKRMIHWMAKKEYFDDKKIAWFFKISGCISVDRSIHDTVAKEKAMSILEQGGAFGIFCEGTRNEITCKDDKIDEVYEIVKDDYTREELIKYLKGKGFKFTQVETLIELNKKKVISKKELKEYVMDPDNSLLKLLKDKRIKQDVYDKSLLIPLKFGAVSMAKKNDSYIVPFGTSGDYKFRSKNLTVVIGKPFKVGDMSLEEANDKLAKELISLMKKGPELRKK